MAQQDPLHPPEPSIIPLELMRSSSTYFDAGYYASPVIVTFNENADLYVVNYNINALLTGTLESASPNGIIDRDGLVVADHLGQPIITTGQLFIYTDPSTGEYVDAGTEGATIMLNTTALQRLVSDSSLTLDANLSRIVLANLIDHSDILNLMTNPSAYHTRSGFQTDPLFFVPPENSSANEIIAGYREISLGGCLNFIEDSSRRAYYYELSNTIIDAVDFNPFVPERRQAPVTVDQLINMRDAGVLDEFEEIIQGDIPDDQLETLQEHGWAGIANSLEFEDIQQSLGEIPDILNAAGMVEQELSSPNQRGLNVVTTQQTRGVD
jgi:hypothetical protein